MEPNMILRKQSKNPVSAQVQPTSHAQHLAAKANPVHVQYSGSDLNKIEAGQIKLQKATPEIRQAMQDARKRLEWDQVKLAQVAGLPKETIKAYENGEAIVKGPELAKINKALGLQLKKPQPIKLDDNSKN